MEPMNEKGKELFRVHETNTSFNVIEKDDEYIIVLGDKRICEKTFEDLKEAIEHINSKSWDLIHNSIVYVVQNLGKHIYENREKDDNDELQNNNN